jgi:hypothetical protein
MKIGNRINDETVNELLGQIEGLIIGHRDLTSAEVLWVLMCSIAGVIQEIDCPGCRRKHAKMAQEVTPRLVRKALVEAAKIPAASSHTH